MNVCIIGTKYVGIVTKVSLAYLSDKVTCVYINQEKIDKLKQGISPIYEPCLNELLEIGISYDALSFTTQLEEGAKNAEVIFIAIGTPQKADGKTFKKNRYAGLGKV